MKRSHRLLNGFSLLLEPPEHRLQVVRVHEQVEQPVCEWPTAGDVAVVVIGKVELQDLKVALVKKLLGTPQLGS